MEQLRIQKYKFYKYKHIIVLEIFCDYKNKKVEAWECKSCEFFKSVHPDKKEVKCKANL